VPNFTFIVATCRPCGAKNPFFGPLSKNNTGKSGVAALRAGLSVMKEDLSAEINWLRRILGISKRDKIRNEVIGRQLKQERTVGDRIRQRRLIISELLQDRHTTDH